jgi:hypothetical protein
MRTDGHEREESSSVVDQEEPEVCTSVCCSSGGKSSIPIPTTRPFRFASSKYGGIRPAIWMTVADIAINIIGHWTPLSYGPFVICQRLKFALSVGAYLECEDENDFHDGKASCEGYCSNGSGPHSPLAVVD